MKVLQSKIKMSALLTALLFAFSFHANAQKGEFGLRLMPTFSSTDIQTAAGGEIEGKANLGFGAGAVLGFSFSDHIGLQAEAIYSSTSQKYTEEDVEHKIKLQYVNIPLLLSLNTGKTSIVNFNVVAGPQMGISVGSSITGVTTSDSTKAVLSVKKGDLGVAFGAGIDIGVNEARTLRVGLGYRGVRGLLDISDNNSSLTTDSYYVFDRTHTKTNSIYLGLSYLF